MKYWLVVALPLFLFGSLWFYIGVEEIQSPTSEKFNLIIGVIYLLISLMSISKSKFTRVLSKIGWVPLFLIFPVGTIWGIFAWKNLSRPNAREEDLAYVKSLDKEELMTFVIEQCEDHFSIKPSQREEDFESLGIPKGTINIFLDNLFYDHGINVSSEDSKDVKTVMEIAELSKDRMC